MVFDGKSDTSLKSLFTAGTIPEEGVAAANLSELAFIGEVGFAEGCDVDSVAHKFSGYEGRSAFWSSGHGGG